jgi:ubiquinone/menaquinone biosynthesis C-methylase UbiE
VSRFHSHGREIVTKDTKIDVENSSRKGALRWRNAADPAEVKGLEDMLMAAGNASGMFYPEERTVGGFVVYQADQDELAKPVQGRFPPGPLRHYYGIRDGKYIDDLYFKSGLSDTRAIKSIVASDGYNLPGENILEFGCSAGRLIRHFEEEAKSGEVWGIDLHSAAIHWAQAHLSPPFNFCLNTTTPHLPFEDGYFGFIFAGSVWTHIGELDDAWLLEIRRITRRGGRIYITISDENTMKEIEAKSPDHPSVQHTAELDKATDMLSKQYLQFVTRSGPWFQRSVYNRDAWLKKISRWFDVRMARENAYGWQTGILLAKR